MPETYENENIKQSTRYIRISEVRAVGSKLIARLDLSENIKKYFLKDNFVVQYDKNIEDVDESILAIPPLFVIAPVAWATGADIYVEKLDQTSFNSLHKVRQVFQGWYPRFSSSGRIYVNNLIGNKFNNEQTALLFSGGLDSTTSYIMHKDEHPILISLLRGETSSYEAEFYDKVKNTFLDFAKNEGVEIHFIKSDVWDMNSSILNNRLLTRDFGVVEWYTKVSHGLIFLGLSAPLTVEKVRTLYIASTFTQDYEARTGNGSHFLAFTDFSWSDIKVIYDGQELTRMAKIKHIFKKNRTYGKNLRICNPIMHSGYYKNSHSQLYFKNCGSCIKCVQTVTELIVAGIDPVECNFDLNDKVLDYVRCLFVSGVVDLAGEQPEFWRDIQRHLSDTINDDVYRRYQTHKFFEWYRDFDLSTSKFRTNKTLRRLCWAYCLMRYRGICDALKLMIKNV
jgi:7-cyano-7-deazaguanine synthase in queuosine biosynthesis